VQEAAGLVEGHWKDEGWDQQVATFLVAYLGSLREANEHLLRIVYGAAIAEVSAIACVAAMALTQLVRAM
jgi:hypothetical protein